MISGFDSYKLSVNNINSINADTIDTSKISNEEFNSLSGINTSITIQQQLNDLVESGSTGIIDYITTKSIYISKDTSFPLQLSDGTTIYFKISSTGDIYGSSLYINNVLIDFSSFATLTNLLNYVSNSSLNSILNGYYQKSETWSRSDTSNEIEIRTGYTSGTCKTVDDAIIESVSATDADVAALDASVLALDGTLTGIAGDLAILNGTVAEQQIVIDEQQIAIDSLETTVGEHTTSIEELQAKTVNIDVGTGVEGNYTNFSGSINCTNINPTVDTLNIATSNYSLNNINIGNISSVICINGFPYTPFNIFQGFSQW